MNPSNHAVHAVRQAAQPLSGARDDYDQLLDLIGDAAFGAMRRRLKKLVEKQHGDIKTHLAQEIGGGEKIRRFYGETQKEGQTSYRRKNF